jgi:hypothetical protein
MVMHSDPTCQFGPLLEAAGLVVRKELERLTPETPLHSDLDLERHTELGLREDVLRITLPGLTHTGMMDQLIIAPEAHRAAQGTGALAGHRGIALQNRLCREFFDTHLRGLDRQFPSKVLAENPEVVRRDLSGLRREARALAGQ